MFSVLKRKYREELRATKYRNQVKEVKFKFLIHNIDRATSISVIIQMRISIGPRLGNFKALKMENNSPSLTVDGREIIFTSKD